MTWIINQKKLWIIYHKLLNWLFPLDEFERDIVPFSSYHYFSPSPFQKLIINYLAWNGIDKKGNISSNKVYPTHAEILENRTVLRECGFASNTNIEKLILSEFLETKVNIPDLNPVKFACVYEKQYVIIKVSDLTSQRLKNQIKPQIYIYLIVGDILVEFLNCLLKNKTSL
ncbi:hypothetical protein [Chryseobacterium terrae]|uniref:Uncharacterized protein n=1 Tax=Chryseobacterium terrae TaxID=3163299 RepID=A0ABW8Y6S0_9FLAO